METIPTPQVPDHQLLRCIGSGNYGQVWLACNLVGTFRAVKIVNRNTLPADRPFEREFEGVRHFEPISRSHAGLVSILHLGGNPAAGYFYYVMEVGDDTEKGRGIDPLHYTPRTLHTELKRPGRLPLPDCLRIGLSLASALGYLHREGLVHRDIKPSNVIFVNRAAKFADIGLVTQVTVSGEPATFVGTEGYVPPEGPGKPSADVYALGKVLYQITFGQEVQRFPEWPYGFNPDCSRTQLRQMNQLILKACELDPRKRFQSGAEMFEQLVRIQNGEGQSEGVTASEPGDRTGDAQLNVVLLGQTDLQPDGSMLTQLQSRLTRENCQVFLDQETSVDVAWAQRIENHIATADVVVPLLSGQSVKSEMLAYELELANDTARQRQGRPKVIPVRLPGDQPWPDPIAGLLDPGAAFSWNDPEDIQGLVEQLLRRFQSNSSEKVQDRLRLEAVGGAVPLDSKFYVVRPDDEAFRTAITRGDSIVLVKGARQMGKTSLLARGLDQARNERLRVISTDFQKLNIAGLASLEEFYLTLGESVAEQLDAEVFLQEMWDSRRSPNTNFERYLRREILDKLGCGLVWGMDEVDRLIFGCPYGGEVFSLFRSWHNRRALDPEGPWSRLTLAIAYATEAQLFVTGLVQSPFNVGTQLVLEDFSRDQVAELNRRHGSPLATGEDLEQFMHCVGGQPYLVRLGLHEMASGSIGITEFLAQSPQDEGIFADHLRRLLAALVKDAELTEVMRAILRGEGCPTAESFYRLRSAGMVSGGSAGEARPRCQLYADYLKRQLR